MAKKDKPTKGNRDNTFWDEYEMHVKPIVEPGKIKEQFDEKGNRSVVQERGQIVWVAGGHFTKVFPRLEDVLKKISNLSTRRLLDYIIFNIEKDSDCIEFNILEIVEYCGLSNKKSIHKPINELIEKKVLRKIDGYYHKYMVNPYFIYSGVYPDDRIEDGKKRKAEKKEKEKNEKASNTDFTKADTD